MLIDWWRGQQGERTFWILSRNQIISELWNSVFQNKVIHTESEFQSLSTIVFCVLLNTISKCHSDFSRGLRLLHGDNLIESGYQGLGQSRRVRIWWLKKHLSQRTLLSSVNFCSVSSIIRWGGKMDSGWGGEGGRDEGYKLTAWRLCCLVSLLLSSCVTLTYIRAQYTFLEWMNDLTSLSSDSLSVKRR